MEDGTDIWYSQVIRNVFSWASFELHSLFLQRCEQVSHHPPVSSFIGQAPTGKYSIYGVSEPTVQFKGNAVKTKPLGIAYMKALLR